MQVNIELRSKDKTWQRNKPLPATKTRFGLTWPLAPSKSSGCRRACWSRCSREASAAMPTRCLRQAQKPRSRSSRPPARRCSRSTAWTPTSAQRTQPRLQACCSRSRWIATKATSNWRLPSTTAAPTRLTGGHAPGHTSIASRKACAPSAHRLPLRSHQALRRAVRPARFSVLLVPAAWLLYRRMRFRGSSKPTAPDK